MVFRVVEVDSTPFTLDRDKVVVADFFVDGIAASTDFIGIDLDNAGGTGPYKHEDGYGIKLVGASGNLLKDSSGAKWDALFGVVLSITAISAEVGWLQVGSLHLRDTGRFESSFVNRDFPVILDLTVSSGDFTKTAAAFKTIEPGINTTITLDDIAGLPRTPAVGDLIVRVDKISGAGTALIHYSLFYFVE